MPVADSAFRRHEKVVATEDLPGIPAGTHGKVMLVDGINWIRYRVKFDNGTERGTIDGKFLASAKEWDRSRPERRAPGEE
jgi:hypothetical protein